MINRTTKTIAARIPSRTISFFHENGAWPVARPDWYLGTDEDTPLIVDDADGTGTSGDTSDDGVLFHLDTSPPAPVAETVDDFDVDGDTLSVRRVNGVVIPSPVAPISLPSGALLTIDPDGTFLYDSLGVRTDPRFRPQFRPQPRGPLTTKHPLPHNAYFELVAELSSSRTVPLRHDMTGTVRLRAEAEPVATIIVRRVSRFLNRLMQES